MDSNCCLEAGMKYARLLLSLMQQTNKLIDMKNTHTIISIIILVLLLGQIASFGDNDQTKLFYLLDGFVLGMCLCYYGKEGLA